MASDAPRKVLVPIADGTEPMEAVITIDILRRSGADVTVASVSSGLQVDASWGLRLVADVLVSDCAGSTFDLGGMPGSTNLRDCEALESLVRKHVSEGRVYAAICAAPAVAFGSWGLLKGLQATCYPSFMEKMPTDATAVELRVVQDGRCVTSRGPGTTMEFALELVEQLYGKEKADEVAGPMVMCSQPANLTVKELNSVSWTSNKTPQILVPIANGSEEMEATMIIDILHRAKAKVVVASVGEKLEIVASRKVKIVADMLLEEAAKLEYDLIVLPGGIGGAQEFASSEKLINLLKKQAESRKPYGAICASPALVLEPHGLLKVKEWIRITRQLVSEAKESFDNQLKIQKLKDTIFFVNEQLTKAKKSGAFSNLITDKINLGEMQVMFRKDYNGVHIEVMAVEDYTFLNSSYVSVLR
ncbi:hypothetical protein QJS10_CPA01g02130 [Acorus calamus]|uniref:DJ-1/PfpI domain-containing protein n=1 Tax=Acorus calamus TaxID=4465 RepID=A0AAV9FGY6_ACOCL|nr:hypothetical protein QJS10_CPA01g02130 [Acorus calamus]